MKKLVSALLLLISILFTPQITAQIDSGTHIKNVRPQLQILRFSGKIVVDGEFNEADWQSAAVAQNFVETNPGDQTKPEFPTRVLLGYDTDNLYLGFIATANPAEVRAAMRDRDEIWQDDNVGIIIDTFGDGAWAYEIFANPLGIQGDIRWVNNRGEDSGFDLIYHSRGKITTDGFQVEFAIPFSSLRFPNRKEQIFSATFWRNMPRESRHQYSWAAIDRDEPCWTCQWGKLLGISNINSPASLELLPSLVTTQSSSRADAEDVHSKFKHDNPEPDVSIGLKYALTPSITLEGTINPDFSQVESDADQIDVNNTFALSFPERRPFFQEGTDLFQTNLDIVYTRALNDPSVAAKITGRHNRTSLAVLSVLDENSPIIIPLQERSEFAALGKSVSNILRLKQTFWEDSDAGILFSDRRLQSGGYNSVLALDGQFRFLKNFRLEWQVAASKTKEPNDTTLTPAEDLTQPDFSRGKHSSAFDGEEFNGYGMKVNLERDARIWNYRLAYSELSPTFRADNGFIVRNDFRRLYYWNGWFFRPNGEWVKKAVPSFNLGRAWNYHGRQKDEWLRGEIDVDLKYQSNVELSYLASNETFRNIYFSGIRRFRAELSSRFSEIFGFEIDFENGRYIARNEDTPVLGEGYEVSFGSTIQPTTRWIIEPEISYALLESPDLAQTIFDGYVLRTRMNYQFTRELFLRLVFQYNKFNHRISVEPLLTYRINPFSLFYVGATDGYKKFDVHKDYRHTSRQFFMKLQYLFNI